MINPMMDTVKELKKMHEDLIKHLKEISRKLDKIIEQNDQCIEWETRNHGYKDT